MGMSGTYPFDLDFHLDTSSSEINGEIASNLTKSNLAVSDEFGTGSAPLDMGDIMGAITTPLGAYKSESEVVTYLATDAATGTGCTLSGRLMNFLGQIGAYGCHMTKDTAQSTVRPGATALPRCEGPVSEGDGLGSASASQPELARASALVSEVGEVSRAHSGFAPGEVSRRGNMSRCTYRTSPSWLADLPTGATLDPPLSCYSLLPSSASVTPLGLCALETELYVGGFVRPVIDHYFTIPNYTDTKGTRDPSED